eukprot:m.14795 g.14795  ORF g.14795 m.14795 type:complete len:479 (+) comp4370_c0_seq1:397-1833(+)
MAIPTSIVLVLSMVIAWTMAAEMDPILGVWEFQSGSNANCAGYVRFFAQSFVSMNFQTGPDCSTPVALFAGLIAYTSPASGSSADKSMIINYVVTGTNDPNSFIHNGATFVFDVYETSATTMTFRNPVFENAGAWPANGIDFTLRGDFSTVSPEGVYDISENDGLVVGAKGFLINDAPFDSYDSNDSNFTVWVGALIDQPGATGNFTVYTVASSGSDSELSFNDNSTVHFEQSGVDDVEYTVFDQRGVNGPYIASLRSEDALNGVWNGRDAGGGSECLQVFDFESGSFNSYRILCDGANATGYFGRYELLPNNQLRVAFVSTESNSNAQQLTLDISFNGVNEATISSDDINVTMFKSTSNPDAIVIEFVLDGDIASFDEQVFKQDLVNALSIPAWRIEILSVTAGSIVVETSIIQDQSTPNDENDLNSIIETLTNSGMIGFYTVQSASVSRSTVSSSSVAFSSVLFVALASLVAFMFQ